MLIDNDDHCSLIDVDGVDLDSNDAAPAATLVSDVAAEQCACDIWSRTPIAVQQWLSGLKNK